MFGTKFANLTFRMINGKYYVHHLVSAASMWPPKYLLLQILVSRLATAIGSECKTFETKPVGSKKLHII